MPNHSDIPSSLEPIPASCYTGTCIHRGLLTDDRNKERPQNGPRFLSNTPSGFLEANPQPQSLVVRARMSAPTMISEGRTNRAKEHEEETRGSRLRTEAEHKEEGTSRSTLHINGDPMLNREGAKSPVPPTREPQPSPERTRLRYTNPNESKSQNRWENNKSTFADSEPPLHKISESLPEAVGTVWNTTSMHDVTMHLELDCEHDSSNYLEELSRLKRLGRFNEARKYFDAIYSALGDLPDLVVEYVDMLSRQGAFSSVSELFAPELHNTMISALSLSENDYSGHHRMYPRAIMQTTLPFGLPLKSLEDGWDLENLNDDWATHIKMIRDSPGPIGLQVLCHMISFESQLHKFGTFQRPHFTQAIDVIPKYVICEHLLSEDRVWDMRDYIRVLLVENGIDKTIRWCFPGQNLDDVIQTILDGWTQENDESSNLAVLDIMTTLAFQLVPNGQPVDESGKQSIIKCMNHARQLATSIGINFPESIKSSPYLWWILAEESLKIHLQGSIKVPFAYLEKFPGIVIWRSNLPIYVPFMGETPGWNIPSAKDNEMLLLGLNATKELGDYCLKARYLEELIRRSEAPHKLIVDLMHLQKDVQGDAFGYLRTCLTQYLLATDDEAREDLSNKLTEFDTHELRRLHEDVIVDGVTVWCMRRIQRALCISQGGSQKLQNSYLRMEASILETLPSTFCDSLPRLFLGQPDGANNIAPLGRKGYTTRTAKIIEDTIRPPRLDETQRSSAPHTLTYDKPRTIVRSNSTDPNICVGSETEAPHTLPKSPLPRLTTANISPKHQQEVCYDTCDGENKSHKQAPENTGLLARDDGEPKDSKPLNGAGSRTEPLHRSSFNNGHEKKPEATDF